jgi:predicted MPP superfamily phosphohydrolase
VALTIVAAVAALLLLYSLIEPLLLETKSITFTSPDLPVAFDGTRVVFVSDIHRGPFLSEKRVRSLVDRINSLKPDLILLGGDYVYRFTSYEDSAFRQLGNLRARLGVYAVLGNHDYGNHPDNGKDVANARRAIQTASIKLLENEGVWITPSGGTEPGPRIRVGGVRDLKESFPDVESVLYGTGPQDFVLLVSHNPDFVEQLAPGQIDLVLSGHTHGGQVTFFGLWAPLVPSDFGQRFRSGTSSKGSSPIFVSTGVGTIFPPVRFFARPEIVILTLHRGAQAAFGR